jgi:hypothetical protein
MAGILLDPAVMAGILPEQQDPGQLARDLARTADFRSTGRDPYAPNIKKYVYIILY